ncbi:MAG: hypothetical protein WC587_02155 [Candidatus Paceibacterota bacterium]
MGICQQKTRKIVVGLFVFAQLLLSLTAFADSGAPTILSYQGRLTDENGNLLGGTGTTYYFKFSIWDNTTVGSGNQLWPLTSPATTTATVRQGVFNVDIGDTANGYPEELNYNFNTNKNIYLQVEVSANNNSSQTLAPRRRVSSSAFSQIAGSVSGAGQSSFGTTTPFANSVVSIEATSTLAIPLFIKAALSQVANLFQIQDFSGSSFFVVDNDGDVGIGTSTPARKLNILGANSAPQFRLSQTGLIFGELYADSAGDVRISSTGGNIRQNDENFWVCSGGGCNVDTPGDKGNIVVENSVIFDNKFKLKQINASTTVMYDTINNAILEFDEGQ